MSHSAPTDAQLLDMAREVLAVCQDRSLRDIIEDLSITHSSEQTINRIFDGQVRSSVDSWESKPATPSTSTRQKHTDVKAYFFIFFIFFN